MGEGKNRCRGHRGWIAKTLKSDGPNHDAGEKINDRRRHAIVQKGNQSSVQNCPSALPSIQELPEKALMEGRSRADGGYGDPMPKKAVDDGSDRLSRIVRKHLRANELESFQAPVGGRDVWRSFMLPLRGPGLRTKHGRLGAWFMSASCLICVRWPARELTAGRRAFLLPIMIESLVNRTMIQVQEFLESE